MKTPYTHSLLLLIMAGSALPLHAYLSSNDPCPLYHTGNPRNIFIGQEGCKRKQRARFSASVFRQSADKAGNCGTDEVPLGDIHGRWNMLALFFPEEGGSTLVKDALVSALNLTNDENCIDTISSPSSGIQNNEITEDKPNPHQFGFFSVPIDYRKYGARIELDFAVCQDVGLLAQTSVAHIYQKPAFEDQSCDAEQACGGTIESTCKKMVTKKIMPQHQDIADILGVDITEFSDTQAEDLSLSLYWSRCFEINKGYARKAKDWPHFTITPYIVGHVCLPLSKTYDPNHLFSLPFGNGPHRAGGFNAGFTLNFLETVYTCLDGGMIKYSSEHIDQHPVPTHDRQAGIFPRKADICCNPGTTWTFGAMIGCDHFVDRLSGWVEFRTTHHAKDTINIINPIKENTSDSFATSDIKVKKMQQESEWSSNMVNIGLNYDISPNVALGFLWQAPIRQHNAYRSNTIMGNITASF